MGFLHMLGLDEIADSLHEFTQEIDGLKDELIDTVIGSDESLKGTIDEIQQSLTNQE